jgi:hypothetical protein
LYASIRAFTADAKANAKKISFQSDWHGGLDTGGVKDGSGGTFVYEPRHVGKLDCFHPSVEGQKALAEVALKKAKWE